MTTFVDTSAFLALLNAADKEHPRAGPLYQQFVDAEESLITTNYVILETIALLQRRLGMAAVATFQDDILPTLNIEWLTEEVHTQAITALIAASRRRVSLVDWTSFVVMRQMGLIRVFAFDSHFPEHGFEQIPH